MLDLVIDVTPPQSQEQLSFPPIYNPKGFGRTGLLNDSFSVTERVRGEDALINHPFSVAMEVGHHLAPSRKESLEKQAE